ncbi:MAG: NADH-quinone oxidoreductase subunit L [Firmicutes bacterium]|jgi:NADH-quinone oxidoreductase subunit L|nr:NADH-quinone oxidoreductase subunit L [Bacillota bacterium]
MLAAISSFLGSGANIIYFMIVLPLAVGAVLWLVNNYYFRLILALLSAAVNLLFAVSLYRSEGFYLLFPFSSGGLDIAFNVYRFSSLFLTFIAACFLLVILYSVVYLKGKKHAGLFMLYMYISLAMMNGAFMADNLGVLLFFWEGLLCTLFGILLINNLHNPRTAVKALTLSGTADLLMMLGIIITAYQAGTLYISQMEKLPVSGLAAAGFACMMLGAIGKAGSMPFHSWIPNAAEDAPTPFMVAFPAALEKFLGIYLAARIAMDIYDLQPGSGASIAVMTIGTLTIVLAVAMALIQKDMKRLLSYHAISQVGYMVLGIGTALPIGIMGGIFHMLNHVIYKSCLFMTAGSVELQTGTTDLKKIGGLGRKMPITMICFIISALAISGVPPLNGFFSKELVFDAALESNLVFYLGALLGAFMTAISFLKLGRAAFGGEFKLPSDRGDVRESSAGMYLPMAVLAILCVLFGVANTLPLDGLLGPALGDTHRYSGWPHSVVLVLISVAVLLLALGDHLYGSKKSGGALYAADHIHYAPGLHGIYNLAERQVFDPYMWIMQLANAISAVCNWIERGIIWLYDDAVTGLVKGAGTLLQRFNDGSLSRYLLVAVTGVAGIIVIILAIN